MAVKINKRQMHDLSRQIQQALEMTAEEVTTDMKRSEILPYREGNLTLHTQPNYRRAKQGVVSIVSSTPYARRLYYHPEYKFNRSHNRFAGGLWFEPYKRGRKKWVTAVFAKHLERLMQ